MWTMRQEKLRSVRADARRKTHSKFCKVLIRLYKSVEKKK